MCDAEALVQVRREAGGTGTLIIEVYIGGILETSHAEPVSNIVNDDGGSGLQPSRIVVPLPSIDGAPVSNGNGISVRMYVQGGNGKKIWWSYMDLSGVNP